MSARLDATACAERIKDFVETGPPPHAFERLASMLLP